MPYADPEKKRAAKKQYRERHKEKIAEYHRTWAAANPDKVKAANERYRAAQPAKVKERTKAWREENHEHLIAYAKARYERLKRRTPTPQEGEK